MKYVMWFDRMYQQFYLPSHMNFGPYLFGMITGVILHKIRLFKIKLGPSKVRIFANKKHSISYINQTDFNYVLVHGCPNGGLHASLRLHFLRE